MIADMNIFAQLLWVLVVTQGLVFVILWFAADAFFVYSFIKKKWGELWKRILK